MNGFCKDKVLIWDSHPTPMGEKMRTINLHINKYVERYKKSIQLFNQLSPLTIKGLC